MELLLIATLLIVLGVVCKKIFGKKFDNTAAPPKPKDATDIQPWGYRNADGDFIYTSLSSYENAAARAYIAMKQDIDNLKDDIECSKEEIEDLKENIDDESDKELIKEFKEEIKDLKEQMKEARKKIALKRLIRKKLKEMDKANLTLRPSENLVALIGNRIAWYKMMDELAREWYETGKDDNLDWDMILLCQIEICRTWKPLDD